MEILTISTLILKMLVIFTVVGFIAIGLSTIWLFIICELVSQGKKESKELRAENYEEQYKEFYEKPFKCKKNKLRGKAINSLKSINKNKDKYIYSFSEVVDFIKYIDSTEPKFKIPNEIKAIKRYLRSR